MVRISLQGPPPFGIGEHVGAARPAQDGADRLLGDAVVGGDRAQALALGASDDRGAVVGRHPWADGARRAWPRTRVGAPQGAEAGAARKL